MGTRTRSSTPDLFSSAPIQSLPSAIPSRHVLPTDLPNAVRHLDDHELNQLLSAVIAEQKRRGKKLAVSHESSRKLKSSAVPLTQGKLNAVRAAFKAGVTPSRIARQFGISQSDVRQALIAIATKG